MESILDFTLAIQAIEEAINVTMETATTLELVLEDVEGVGVMVGEMARDARELSYVLLNEAEWESDRATSESEPCVGVCEAFSFILFSPFLFLLSQSFHPLYFPP